MKFEEYTSLYCSICEGGGIHLTEKDGDWYNPKKRSKNFRPSAFNVVGKGTNFAI